MREVMELLLSDVDPDIRGVMEKEATYGPDAYGGVTVTAAMMPTRPVKVWETLPDPLFLIINWQRMRHENRHRKAGQ